MKPPAALPVTEHEFWFIKRAVRAELHRLRRSLRTSDFEPEDGRINIDAIRIGTGEGLMAKIRTLIGDT